MTCLIKSKNKPLLDQYTDMLGSESAAYYVLCKNNGFPLEFTPNGEKSDLFQKLLAKNNYSYRDAIEEKAQMYYSSYYDSIGGDWTMNALDGSVIDENGEPKIDYTPQTIDFSSVLQQPIELTEMDTMSFPEIQRNLIELDRRDYVSKRNPSNMEESHSANVEWLAHKQKMLVDSINKDLIDAFGLEKKVDKDGRVTFVSKEKDDSGRHTVIIQFCEYIANGKKGVYDQTGRIESAANLIQISLLDGDPTTINHELAHHYVRMFWNSEVIQKAVQKLDNGDRSEGWQVRLEEKLVDELVKRTTESEGIWNNFSDMIKTAFLWLTSPVKQSLLRKASLAFRINDQARAIRINQQILHFIDPTVKRVFNSAPNENIERFDKIKKIKGLIYAIAQFLTDSERFYEEYIANKNSILKRDYDEYVLHVTNTLSDLSLSDDEFNKIYIRIKDAKDKMNSVYNSPTHPIVICYLNLSDLMSEIKEIREYTKNNTSGVSTSTSGTTTSTSVDLSELMLNILRGLNTRVYEYLHSVPKSATSANAVQELINKLNSIKEYKDQLVLFISEGIKELAQLKIKLEELDRNGYKDINSQLLQFLWNTIDGFYNPVLDLINEVLGSDIIHGGILSTFGSKLANLQTLSNSIRSHLIAANKIVSQREMHQYLLGDEETGAKGRIDDLLTEEEKVRFMENFDDQLLYGKLFEDINLIQPYIGLASRSRSLIIKVARNMILSANALIRKATIKDADKVINLYFKAFKDLKKLGLSEIQSIFLEKDENGKPTGYFTRRLNYGRFYNDLNKIKDDLVVEANNRLKDALGDDAPLITYDAYNNEVFPPDDDPTVKRILNEYSDKVDDWMCENGDRMFVPEYYKQRRKMLSPRTRRVMLDIQNRINSLRSKAPNVKIEVGGKEVEIQATWELSPEDQQTLVNLLQEYQQLSNHYYSDGTKKTGDELSMAEEISKFNEWKNKKVTYDQNELKFESAIQAIRKKYGNNSTQEARFRKLNTSIIVNPDYYEFVLSRVKLANIPELDALRKRRNDLKKLIHDFDKKGIDVEQKRRQEEYWESVKEIDAQIKQLLDSIQNPNNGEKWSDYFTTELVMYDDSETLLDHMLKLDIRDYRKTHPADKRSDSDLRKDLIRKYQYTYTWYDNYGNEHEGVGLVSTFTRQVPVGTSINNRVMSNRFSKNSLIVQYSQLFSEVADSSKLYNKNYNKQDPHLVQPKKDKYDNSKQFDLIEKNENIKKLYDALIDLTSRSNAKQSIDTNFNYRLPLITGRRLTILRRSGLKEVFDALHYNFSMDWKLNERDDNDINYEDNDLKLRANGTRINTVPPRYIRPLDHPEYITGDVVGSVIALAEAANNFVIKTQLASTLEIVKQQLIDRAPSGIAATNNKQATTNIVKQLTNMMDDQLYANNTKFGDKNSKFTRKQELLIKFFTKFQHFGRILMLGYNFTSMSVGFIESFIRGHLEAFLGKDYQLRDLMHGYYNGVKYTPSMLYQLGSVKPKNKLVALMRRFGLSKSLKESYHGTERNRWIKVFSENLNGMFGFSLGDYANSAMQLSMALSNVRFVDDLEVPTGFYTKHTLIKAMLKAHPELSYKLAKRNAILLYKESSICLEDAYEFDSTKDEPLWVKKEYEQYVTDIIEDRVTGKCYQRLAEALGVVPLNDNPGYGLQILLRPIGVLRNYLFTVIARNWNWAHDLQKRYIDPSGNLVKEDDMVDGYLDIDAGNMNIGLHQGLIGWMRQFAQQLPIIGKKLNSPNFTEETKELYNYAASKVLLEVLTIASLVGISTLLKAMQKGADDDDWWVRFGYLTSVRLVNSFISVLDPTSFLEVIKNISTLISPLNDLLNTIILLSDMVGLSGHSPFDEIKSGSYKGRSRLFKDLMRITPFGNAYEDLNNSALKSRANWYIQQDPITWASIGGAYDQLFGTGK